MEFDRAFVVGKVSVVAFIAYLVGNVFLFPLMKELQEVLHHHLLSGNLAVQYVAVLAGFLVGLLGSALALYVIFAEAEKAARKKEIVFDAGHFERRIANLKKMINEISKGVPKETQEKIQDIKTRCHECGKKARAFHSKSFQQQRQRLPKFISSSEHVKHRVEDLNVNALSFPF